MRYQMIAKLAMKENLKTLADAVKTIAKNETFHATQFFNKIIEKSGNRENIDFDAGYPFHAGTLVESLKFAATDEKNETEERTHMTRFYRAVRWCMLILLTVLITA